VAHGGGYALRSEVEPATGMLFHLVRGFLEIARCRVEAALAALRAAGCLPGGLIAAQPLTTEVRAFLLHGLVRLGETAQADAALTETAESERERPGLRTAAAALRLAQGNPRAATAALAPVLAGSAPGSHQVWLIAAFLLEASARDALGEREAAGRALERGLDLAASDGLLFPFLLHPVPELLERHARQRTAHPAPISKIISAPGGRAPAAPAAGPPEHLPEPLSQAEAPRPALPADQPFRAGDRPRALCVGEHGPDAHAAPVRQARRPPPPGGPRPGPCSRTARVRPARGLTAVITALKGLTLCYTIICWRSKLLRKPEGDGVPGVRAGAREAL
jgi:hypothetical protein